MSKQVADALSMRIASTRQRITRLQEWLDADLAWLARIEADDAADGQPAEPEQFKYTLDLVLHLEAVHGIEPTLDVLNADSETLKAQHAAAHR